MRRINIKILLLILFLLGFSITVAREISTKVYKQEGIKYRYTRRGCEIVGYSGPVTNNGLTIPQVINGHVVTSVAAKCFWNAYVGDTVRLPPTVKYIGARAFEGSSIKHFTVGPQVEVIAENPFSFTLLERIVVHPRNQSFKIFNGALCSWDQKRLICLPSLNEKTLFSVPVETEKIDPYAFSWNWNLQTVDLSQCESLQAIPEAAFYENEKLILVRLPVVGLKKIEARAFMHCFCLDSVELPATVEDIHEDSFLEISPSFQIRAHNTYTVDYCIANNIIVTSSIDSCQ